MRERVSVTMTSVETVEWNGVMEMTRPAFVAYLRVSTQKQGESGLGLDAQRESVHRCVGNSNIICEVVEVESGCKSRPQLDKALDMCRKTGATLVIAKLDRLSRNLKFLASMLEGDLKFVAADNPHANELTLGILAVIAQHEAKIISERTKAALAQARARGTILGNPHGRPFTGSEKGRGRDSQREAATERARKIRPLLDEMGGTSLCGMATALNERGVPTANANVPTRTDFPSN